MLNNVKLKGEVWAAHTHAQHRVVQVHVLKKKKSDVIVNQIFSERFLCKQGDWFSNGGVTSCNIWTSKRHQIIPQIRPVSSCLNTQVHLNQKGKKAAQILRTARGGSRF